MNKISLIIPCYNEEESLPYLKKELDRLMKKMNKVCFEIILVDNCSIDKTLFLLKKYCKNDDRYKFISFSRNFGKDSSMYAGLKASSGDYIAILDADLQDPPSLLIEMYNTIKKENYDSIAAYRSNRNGEPILRSILANIFYKIMNKMSKLDIKSGARDFRLMTRQMVDSVLEMAEYERFTKGIFSWVGFKTKWISFENQERIAGKTKLPTISALKYAISGITSFSTIPLFISLLFGFIFCFISFIYLIYLIINYKTVTSSSIIILILLLGFGLVLVSIGILSKYLSTMYNEIKNRPRYIIKDCSKELKKMSD